jgi:hypothetical protein
MLALLVILVIVGSVPCLIGAIFLSYHFKERRKAALVARVPTSPASAVARMRPGQLVEVTGTLRCPKPLRSELAGRPCAYYRTWVDRVFEQDERDENDEWRRVERVETLASNARGVPFFVEDGTGRVRVTPDGAEVDTQSVFNEFEAGPSHGPIRIGNVAVARNHGLRTLGYRSREEILPIDGPVYVLGVVTSDGGIGRPIQGARDAGFIISYRSEEAVSQSHQGDRLVMWCGFGALALGALIIAIGIIVWLVWG